MRKSPYTPQQKELALRQLHGGATLGEVQAATGIPKGTLASWRRRQPEQEVQEMRADLFNADPEGWADRTEAAETRRRRTAAARETYAHVTTEDRQQLAARVHLEILGLLDRIGAPMVLRTVKLVGVGGGVQEVQVVDVDYDLPPTADTQRLVQSLGVLIEKLQLLTGEATERTENRTGEALDLDNELARLTADIQAGRFDPTKAADA